MKDKEFSRIRKIAQMITTDLSAAQAYQTLEAKTVSLFKASGMTIDDIIGRFLEGYILVSPGYVKRYHTMDRENQHLRAELAKLKEETAPPYLLINADAEITAKMIEDLKMQEVTLIPDNEATVEIFDKVSIRSEAFKEFAEGVTSLCYQEFGADLEIAHTFASIVAEVLKTKAGEG